MARSGSDVVVGVGGVRKVLAVLQGPVRRRRSVYTHYGTKEELFEQVVVDSVVEPAEAAPFDVDDLPGDALALHDMLDRRPHILRLTVWAQLQRPEVTAAETSSYEAEITAIGAAQRDGRIATTIPPVDLMAMLIALITSWSTAAASLRALAPPESAERTAEHRAALAEAVEALCRPASGTGFGDRRVGTP